MNVDAHAGVAPTRAAAAIGAFAAAQQALVILGIVRGDVSAVAFGRETYVSTRDRRTSFTEYRRNPHCRFSHARLAASEVGRLSILEAFSLGGAPEDAELGIDGGFATRLTCTECGSTRAVLRALRAIERLPRSCSRCGCTLIVAGMDVRSRLTFADVRAAAGRALTSLGVRAGDLFTIRRGATSSYFYDWCDARPHDGMSRPATRVVVVGCGNIGSHLAPLIAQITGITSVLLVDPDVYEPVNVGGQAFRRTELGKPKAAVQARVLRALNPALDVTALRARIEDVPLALLADAVVAACVDSRRARQVINEAAWRVSRCWVDAAVDGEELLARVIAYRPSTDGPCLECAWADDDYAALEQVHACERAQ